MNARSIAPLVALVLGLGLVAVLVAEPDPPAPPPAPAVVAVANETEAAPPRAPAPLAPPPTAPASGAASGPRRGRTLAGRVVDAASEAPIPAARVAARDLGTQGVAIGETDAEGRFTLVDVGPGALEVMAVAEGWLLPEPTPVAADASEVVVRLVAGVPVGGQVVLAPGVAGPLPARVEVRVVGSPRFVGGFDPTFTDAEGRFTVPGVPREPGLALVASAPGWSQARLDLPPVTGPLEGLRIELRRLTVTGSVLAEGVARRDDLAVVARPADGPADEAPRARVAADGRFVLTLPRTGDWLVRAEQRGAASPWERVRVSDGAPPDVELVLRAETAVEGRVVTPAGGAAAGARVSAQPTRGGEVLAAAADGEGRFSIPATAGERYVLRAELAGYAPALQGAEAPATDVVLELGVGVRVEVAPFVGPGGRPMAGATLGCDPAGEAHLDEHHGDSAGAEAFEVTLDAEGRPQLDTLPPGRWTLHVLEPVDGPPGRELRGWVLDVEARPGEPVRLSLDASGPRAQVRGVVRGAPAQDLVQVELRPVEPPEGTFGFVAACAAGPDGSFELSAVPPGVYDVLAAWDGGEARARVEVLVGTPAWVELAPR